MRAWAIPGNPLRLGFHGFGPFLPNLKTHPQGRWVQRPASDPNLSFNRHGEAVSPVEGIASHPTPA